VGSLCALTAESLSEEHREHLRAYGEAAADIAAQLESMQAKLHEGNVEMDTREKRLLNVGGGEKPVLVLNFANPVNIGGGVYRGARAQEEDLCRRSSLLRSLESGGAERYYRYNRGLRTYMGSDAVILSPEVEVFRDEDYAFLEETAVVAVATCAAPMITGGLEGMSEGEYRDMFYRRITGLLKCAAHFGYEDLVLGAWGCGAFGNDAALVSDLFCCALEEFRFGGLRARDLFRNVVFAVRSRGGESYNYREFRRNFGIWDG
ncbi:MAG: TIGR02452 family protein, partial [Oscillospiraceae bacterium]|nr:TIGR02452 family protein [Oscillospiraceae bacterium]